MKTQRHDFDACKKCSFVGRSGKYDIHVCSSNTVLETYFVVSAAGEEAVIGSAVVERSLWKSAIEEATRTIDDDPSVSPNARARA